MRADIAISNRLKNYVLTEPLVELDQKVTRFAINKNEDYLQKSIVSFISTPSSMTDESGSKESADYMQILKLRHSEIAYK